MSSQRRTTTTLLMIFMISVLLLQSMVSLRNEDFLSVMKLDDTSFGGQSLLTDGNFGVGPPSYDTSTRRGNFNHTISIMLCLHPVRKLNPGYSIFKTDTLQRFGSGRYNFDIHESANCDEPDNNNICNNLGSPNNGTTTHHDLRTVDHRSLPPPCLAVTMFSIGWRTNSLHCSQPHCKTMLTNDENCVADNYDARAYYTANYPNKGYLPLGPRFDAWSALQLMKQTQPEDFMKKASTRKYAFNAIFAKSTNSGREYLASILDNHGGINNNLPIFTAISDQFNHMYQNFEEKQLNPTAYSSVLLDSVFTLTPAGHNPECFRMYEAVEAGSIPVFVKDDLYVTDQNTVHPCREVLHHWYNAPILVLDSWDDLYPTVERLIGNSVALDEVQAKLSIWYNGFMQSVVREFEDFMINTTEMNNDEHMQ